jgi:hypothetical protein
MLNMNWYKVEICGAANNPRSGHVAVEYDDSLIIFGGLKQNGFLDSGLLKLHFNQARVRSIVYQEEIIRKRKEQQERDN